MIIKNSYGDDWGDKGYGKISMSQRKSTLGACGILNEGFYTTVPNPIKKGKKKWVKFLARQIKYYEKSWFHTKTIFNIKI